MDPFAAVLITITIVTICGICVFIFICTLQPQILYSLHRKKHRTYYISSRRKPNEIDNESSLNNCDSITTNRTSITSNYSDRLAYIKAIERSVRTGRRIEDEKENHSLGSCRQYTDKHQSPRTTTNIQSTEI